MMGSAVWGIHMAEQVSTRPIEQGYVGIGWKAMGDFRQYPDRDTLKRALAHAYPEKKLGALPVDAGTLFRFTWEIREGDFVIYPSKHDRMVNIGRFVGGYFHVENDPDDYHNHRKVEWLGHFPRNSFSQSALNEIGSAVTLFAVRKHVPEFLAKVGADQAGGLGVPLPAEDDIPVDDDSATVAVSRQAEITTEDFVVRQIMGKLSGYEFEEFVAHILECMGYTARVTQRSGDGGVDVIAHKDKLGFEPPILKVQCKRKTDQIPRPDVDQLLGTLGEGEYGLFITLGSFSRQSIELERNRPKLRLIDGEQFVELLLEHYAQLAPRYRSIIPLKQIYVPDPQA